MTGNLSRELGELLRARGLTIATAESCTGGAIAAAITAISGASDYFPGGIVSYSIPVKMALLGVPQAVIENDGVVSAACAAAMAASARRVLGADLALATTGIAGPSGAEPGKPVGTVHLALASPGREPICRHKVYAGDRAAVIAAATHDALALALAYLQGTL
ncbi:MAG: CinA family protein [Thermomicrobiales bacterium]